MRETGGFILALAAIVSYFVLATRFALYQRWPIAHFLVLLAAAALVGSAISRRRGWRKALPIAALALTIGLAGLFVWYTLVFSTYASTAADVAVGDELAAELADLRLPSHTGEALPVLRAGIDRGTLLVFYRGFW